MRVYTVIMYRYADREKHSYVIGVYSNPDKAMNIGLIEESWRGGKYTCEVLGFDLDSEDGSDETILRLERNNPLDLPNKRIFK